MQVSRHYMQSWKACMIGILVIATLIQQYSASSISIDCPGRILQSSHIPTRSPELQERLASNPGDTKSSFQYLKSAVH